MDKRKSSSIFRYVFSRVMLIHMSGILVLFFLVLFSLLISLKTLNTNIKRDVLTDISGVLESSYSLVRNFEMGFQERLEDTLRKPGGLENFIKSLKIYEELLPFVDLKYETIIKENIENIEVRDKVSHLDINEFLMEKYFTQDGIKNSIYIKGKENIVVITVTYKLKELLASILPSLKKKMKFLENLSVFNHTFEPIISEVEKISPQDKQNLENVFITGKPIISKIDSNRFKIYTSWGSNEKTNEIFRSIGMIITVNTRSINTLPTLIILFFATVTLVTFALSTLKIRNFSKQLAELFEKVIRSMRRFRETNFESWRMDIKKSNIAEIDEIVNEYKVLVEEVNISFQEIMALNEELENSYGELERVSSELREIYSEFSQRLSIIAEGYDKNTGNHIERVGKLSAFVAEKLGLDENFRRDIEYFAPLHDIGKIMIPKEILNKKGKLTQEEFELMKKHTIYGGAIFANSERLKVARNIALYHHEKWDGSGYPYGLKGEEIPLEASIVALIDVYDALRSGRPYKKAFTHEKAMQIILNGDDRTNPEHFNPQVLKVFAENSKVIERIWSDLNENQESILSRFLNGLADLPRS